MLTKLHVIKAIKKDNPELTVKQCKDVFEDLLDDKHHTRSTIIFNNTNKQKLEVLFTLKEKYRKEISKHLQQLEEIKKERKFLDKQENTINDKLIEIDTLFKIR